MTTIALWFLVTVSNNRNVSYSPPMPDLATCQFVQRNASETRVIKSRCIQINTVVTK